MVQPLTLTCLLSHASTLLGPCLRQVSVQASCVRYATSFPTAPLTQAHSTAARRAGGRLRSLKLQATVRSDRLVGLLTPCLTAELKMLVLKDMSHRLDAAVSGLGARCPQLVHLDLSVSTVGESDAQVTAALRCTYSCLTCCTSLRIQLGPLRGHNVDPATLVFSAALSEALCVAVSTAVGPCLPTFLTCRAQDLSRLLFLVASPATIPLRLWC